jgi:excinuclease ABC subunit B
LREGLDIPEVSLVAILDADKEGFLRSTVSLIQTIGRAARNVHGKAILYADKITKSIEKALEETDRRRTKQIAHNLEMGITPTSATRNVSDILEVPIPGAGGSYAYKPKLKAAEKSADYKIQTPGEAAKLIKQLEERMYACARELEFEEAARIRDEIKKIQAEIFVA